MNQMLKIIIYIFLFCLFGATNSAFSQIAIDVVGNWNYTIPTSDLSEAGLDFSGTYESAPNQVDIDVFQLNFISNFFFYRWRVDIRRADVDWHSDLDLSVRRTGNGSPFFFNGNITGGTNYQQITTSNQQFFSGTRTRLNIPIQYQISGVSVLLSAKTYETTIIYTVTEL